MTTDITPATLDDLDALCGLLHLLFMQEAEFTPDVDAQRRGLSRIIGDPSLGQIVVARQGGQVVAMVNLLYTVSTALGARAAWLEDMVVAPTCRGRGLGSTLIEGAITLARLHGCRRVTLMTDRDNLAAQGFYERHGFSRSTMLPYRLPLN